MTVLQLLFVTIIISILLFKDLIYTERLVYIVLKLFNIVYKNVIYEYFVFETYPTTRKKSIF